MSSLELLRLESDFDFLALTLGFLAALFDDFDLRPASCLTGRKLMVGRVGGRLSSESESELESEELELDELSEESELSELKKVKKYGFLIDVALSFHS